MQDEEEELWPDIDAFYFDLEALEKFVRIFTQESNSCWVLFFVDSSSCSHFYLPLCLLMKRLSDPLTLFLHHPDSLKQKSPHSSPSSLWTTVPGKLFILVFWYAYHHCSRCSSLLICPPRMRVNNWLLNFCDTIFHSLKDMSLFVIDLDVHQENSNHVAGLAQTSQTLPHCQNVSGDIIPSQFHNIFSHHNVIVTP